MGREASAFTNPERNVGCDGRAEVGTNTSMRWPIRSALMYPDIAAIAALTNKMTPVSSHSTRPSGDASITAVAGSWLRLVDSMGEP